MRKTIHTTPPPITGCVSDPAVSGYDWSRLGLHTFRVSAGTIIDFPLPIGASSQAWIASLWPDARTPTGWGGWGWQPDPVQGRGWLLPERLMCGDVLEFAIDQPDPRGVTVAQRWWGIFDAYRDGWRLTIQGPYATPADAYGAAEELLALDRYQPPKTLADRCDPEPPRVACTRTRHRRG